MKTKDVLRSMGDMLPASVPTPTKHNFAARVDNGVIRQIETAFPSSYFLPVSALGRSPTEAEMNEQNRQVKHPNSVFAEYAFLLPLFAAFEESFPEHLT
jgi:hypothetical protein